MAKVTTPIQSDAVLRVVNKGLRQYFSSTMDKASIAGAGFTFSGVKLDVRSDFWRAYKAAQEDRSSFRRNILDALKVVAQLEKGRYWSVAEFCHVLANIRIVLARTLQSITVKSVRDTINESDYALLDACSDSAQLGDDLAGELVVAEQRQVVRAILLSLERRYRHLLVSREFIRHHVETLINYYLCTDRDRRCHVPLMNEVSVARGVTFGMELDRLLENVVVLRLEHLNEKIAFDQKVRDVRALVEECRGDQGNGHFLADEGEQIILLGYGSSAVTERIRRRRKISGRVKATVAPEDFDALVHSRGSRIGL
ncbi:MAG: hypothetical protein HY817_02395 [Candidatus Abawacabacteria bacterium]|nr:hypothetical protein [Candidatus Abawacabacteria bacterium]